MLDKNKEILIHSSLKFIKQKEYWSNKLSGDITTTGLFLKDSHESRDKQESHQRFHMELPGELSRHLLKLGKNSDVSLFIILLSGLKSLIYRYVNDEDIIVQSPLYKEKISAETWNDILLIRDQVKSNMSFKELLLAIRQSLLDAYENQDYPFHKLVEFLFGAFRGSTPAGFSNILCMLENIHDYSLERKGPETIGISFQRKDDVVLATVSYDGNKYDRYYIEQFSRHLPELLKNVLQNLDAKISTVSFLKEKEKEQLLFDFNRTDKEYPADKTLHGLFAEQAERTPARTAVKYEDKHLTYQQLNIRSDRLARILEEGGVQVDDIVGILVERSIEMVVSLLAILKAGGAYLPIDPDTPVKRMLLMLEESRASLLLTQKSMMEKNSLAYLQGLHLTKNVVRQTAHRAAIEDFDSMLIPDRSLVDYEKYSRHIGQALVTNSIALQGTRGCPYHCAYCHIMWSKRHVVRSAQNIFNELMLYYNMGVRRFTFVDDVFNLNSKNSSEFFQLVIGSGLDVQIFFPNGLRGDILSEEFIDLMVEAGTINFAMALETASPRMQKLIGKEINLEKFRHNIEYVCRKHPQVIMDLFTMHALPTETEEEAMMTLEFIKGIKWLHFPYINILTIYSGTKMEKLALENGVSRDSIARSDYLGHHELSDTLTFDKQFTKKYQTEFLNDYFLNKERLLHVLPHQMEVLSEEEIVKKYNSYLPVDIAGFDQLLRALDVTREELGKKSCLDKKGFQVPHLNEKISKAFPAQKPRPDALRILILDLSQFFSHETDMLYDVVEAPLGPIYLLTYLRQQLGDQVHGKIAKSRIDFDNYKELKELIHEFKPDIIGLRTLTFYKNFFHRTAALIRQWGVDVPIITGGPYATSAYEKILQDGNIDLVVLGEGEITVHELVKKILGNNKKWPSQEELGKIAGLAFVPAGSKPRQSTREIVIREDIEDILPGKPAGNRRTINRPTDLAYVMYTSGSTGKPKGVMIEHRNALNTVSWFGCTYRLKEGLHVLQMSNYTFDPSVNQVFGTLLSGGTLHMIHKDLLTDIQELRDYIDRHQIHVINSIPLMLSELLSPERKLESIRVVLSGGERLPADIKDRVLECGYQLYNQYGPTEATIDALVGKCSRGPVTLGKPISNVKCYILDKYMNTVPVGAVGELYIGGPGVARGYFGREDLTTLRFIKSPFNPGDRLYRTGDLVSWLPGGEVEFLGRIDHQVKIRGFRIELGEIENELLNFPGINEAEVVVGKIPLNRPGAADNYLCAYVVSGNDLNITRLKKHLADNLPDHMIPNHIITLAAIPRTASGKVDLMALPVPDIQTGDTFIPPASDKEKRMAAIWAEVLEIDQDNIGMNGNFFELGGHSLTATILISRIHREFAVKIPLAELFHGPTMMELCEHIDTAGEETFNPIQPVEKKEYYATSPAMKRLYFLQQMDDTGIAYNVPRVISLVADTKEESLTGVFRELTRRHESLRTVLLMVNERLVQKIQEKENLEFDMEVYQTHNQKKEKINSILKQSIRPFDLNRAPFIRAVFIDTGREENLLLVDMHHITADKLSLDLVISDFTAIYNKRELPPLKLQYKDYAEWQTGAGHKESINLQERYWLNVYSREISILNLPVDFPRPVVQSFVGGRVAFEIGEKEAQFLKEYACTATMYMVLLAVYNILLAKLTGQEDIIIGTPVVGRRHADLEKIIGMFANTLALRNYPLDHLTFGEFFDQLKQNTIDAFENQEYQFEDLVEKAGVTRDTSRNPIFDVMFTLKNLDGAAEQVEINAPDQSSLWDEIYLISKFDMTLNAIDAENRLYFSLEYCTRLFKRETVIRFTRYFKQIVSCLAGGFDRQLWELEIMDTAEKEQILNWFNDTAADYPTDKTIHELFAEQAEKYPGRTAVIARLRQFPGNEKNIQLTYKELDRVSHQLAGVLKEKGVAGDTILAIMVERSLEMVVGIFGILKAGGAYLPIDPAYPKDRIDYILKDSGAAVLLTDEQDSNYQLSIVNCQLLTVNENPPYSRRLNTPPKEANSINHYQLTIHNSQLNSSNLAYILYTSGSTGKPKGVMVNHHSILNTLSALDGLYPFTAADVYLLKTSYLFDVSLSELFGWYAGGGRLAILETGGEKDPQIIMETIQEESVTHINFVPSMFGAFLASLDADKAAADKISSLKYIFLAGEALPGEMVIQARKLITGICLENIYGPTEASIYGSYYSLREWDGNSPILIGKPIPNVKLYILDRFGRPQGIGIPGELCIAGAGIARGYLNRPQLTAEKFRRALNSHSSLVISSTKSFPNDQCPMTNDRFYRTGDLARWLADGNIQFLGRMDRQIKISGFRVELGEIQSHLAQRDDITEVVVIDRKSPTGETELCAYIVSISIIDPSILRDYLALQLPGFMIPTHFVQLESIPLNTSGKIDIKALPEPGFKADQDYIAPGNELQQKLVKIFAEVLNLDPGIIGIDSNFFQLGGHSLKAIFLLARIHKELNIRLELAELFKMPTVRHLYRLVVETEESTCVSIEAAEKKEYYALSSAQERLYVLQQLDPGKVTYNMPVIEVLENTEETDKNKIETALKKLIQRHESLRTSFRLAGGEPVQQIHPVMTFELEYFNMGPGATTGDLTGVVDTFLLPFDLSRAPLLRAGLIRAGNHTNVLVVDMHHIISDEVSMDLIVKDFISLYQGEALARLRLHYKDYSQWQKRQKQGEAIKKQEEYWLGVFREDIPILNLISDYERPTELSFQGSSSDFEIHRELAHRLKQMALTAGVTMNILLLAIYNILLAKYTGQEGILVGIPAAGRTHSDLQNIVGFFSNMLAVRNTVEEYNTLDNFLQEVKENALKAYENQDYPFEELVNKLGIQREPGRHPLIDTVFVVKDTREQAGLQDTPAGKAVKPGTKKISHFDLMFLMKVTDNSIKIMIEYSHQLFDQSTIEEIGKQYIHILEQVVENKNISIKEITISHDFVTPKSSILQEEEYSWDI